MNTAQTLSTACYPRFVYSGCSADSHKSFTVFYAVSLPLHVLTAAAYSVVVIKKRPTSLSEARTLASWMRFSVFIYSWAAVFHHLSLLTSEPLFTRPITELLHNVYCSFIFVAVMQILRTWLLASAQLAPITARLRRIADVVVVVAQLLAVTAVFVLDTVLFLAPDFPASYNFGVQYGVWGLGSFLTGILFVVFAITCERNLRKSRHRTTRRLLLVFRGIYVTYVILGGPYAALYVALIVNDAAPAAWFIGYTAFNLAGPITAAVLFPLLWASADAPPVQPASPPASPRTKDSRKASRANEPEPHSSDASEVVTDFRMLAHLTKIDPEEDGVI